MKGTNIEERESTHNTFEIPTLNTILNKGGYLEKYVRRKEEKKNYKKNNSKNGNLLLNKRVFLAWSTQYSFYWITTYIFHMDTSVLNLMDHTFWITN